MAKDIKVVSKEILSARFHTLAEYDLQMPSLSDDGFRKTVRREVLHTSDSVVVLIHAADQDCFVLCEEYRTGVFFNAGDDDALLLQCVAGMIDKTKTPEEIARLEAMEEAGVAVDTLEPIASVYASPGRMTEKTHVFFAPVAIAPDGGIFGLEEEGEQIRVRLISRRDAYAMMDAGKIIDSMTCLALNWYRRKNP